MKRIERLEKLIRRRSRQTAPFSKDKPAESRRRPGRKEGHPGAFMPEPDHVDEEVVARLSGCPQCGGDIDRVEDILQFVVDLPEVRAHVLRIITQRGWCPCRRRTVPSSHPRQTSRAGGKVKVSLGPRAMALCADRKHRMGMPYRDIANLFGAYFGLRLTHGAIVQGCLRLSERGRPTYQALVHLARRSSAVHTDDTGWRINVESAWLWVFATDQITISVVARSRGSDVVLATLGEDFEGLLERAQCLGHPLRRAVEMEAEQDKGAARFPRAGKGPLKDAIALSHRHGELAPSTMCGYARGIERRADQLLASHLTHEDNRKLRDHLLAHRDQLFPSLYDPMVPATNNLAEQQLRGAVVPRKIGGCNRTDTHAQSHAIVASVAQTAHRNGLTLTDLVRDWMRVRPPPVGDPTIAAVLSTAAPLRSHGTTASCSSLMH